MISVMVSVKARLDIWSHWRDFVSRHAHASLEEPGCLRFDVRMNHSEATTLLLEKFVDADALANHRASAHYRRWSATISYFEAEKHAHLEWGPTTNAQQLPHMVQLLRESGQSIVWTNGVFDLLGPHHVTMLMEARSQGSWLIVGVNDDASTARLKPGRPVRPLADRAAQLAALRCVDAVIPYGSEGELEELLNVVRPDVMAKGADWQGKALTGQQYAGRVHWCRRVDAPSTTDTLRGLGEAAQRPAGDLVEDSPEKET